MPGDLIGIHVGQAGTEIGQEYWKRICHEHSVSHDGFPLDGHDANNGYGHVFSHNDDKQYVPRACFIDLEPRVTSHLSEMKLFDPKRIFCTATGGGAGNSWVNGYTQKQETGEQIMEMIQSEAENSNRVDGFFFTHSISGGTGSGLGSWIIEKIRDEFDSQFCCTFSVFPQKNSNVVIQPYNAVMTLNHLIEHSDMTMALDTEGIDQVASKRLRKTLTMNEIDKVIARIMAGVTAPVRFGSLSFGSLFGVVDHMAPLEPFKFVFGGYGPIDSAFDVAKTRTHYKSKPEDLLKEFSKGDCLMSSDFFQYTPSQMDCVISGLTIFQGDGKRKDINDALYRTSYAKPYGHSLQNYCDIDYTCCNPTASERSAVFLLNHSNMHRTLGNINRQFKSMFERRAFMTNFNKNEFFDGDYQPMQDATSKLDEVINAYKDPWMYCSGGRQPDSET